MIDNKVCNPDWKPAKLSQLGPQLSHMLFADDLMLFGHASYAQARMIMDTLGTFCCMSGMAVNAQKS